MNKLKPVLEWLKSHWLIAVLGALVVGGVPAMIIASTGWNESQVQTLQKELTADAGELDLAKARVTYRVDAVGPQDKATELPHVPNEVLTKWFKERRVEKAQAARSVIDTAVKFNRGPRSGPTPREELANTFLVLGLFPQPAKQDEQIKPREMARAFAGDSVNRVLAIAKAGMPPDGAQLSSDLRDQRTQQISGILPPDGKVDQLSKEQQDQIAAKLLAYRVKRYQDRAEKIGVYADASVFRLPPMPPPDQDPTLEMCWEWQTRHWVHEDLMRAVAYANKDSAGQGVPGAIVKRVELISVDPLPGLAGAVGGATIVGAAATEGAAPGDPNAAPTNPAVSITGRHSGPGTGNGLYDVRTADVWVIASAKNLPKFLDALAATNFMTVIACDIEHVDPLEELRNGFFYGSDPVVRARLRVESLWLRQWTTPHMPLKVKQAIGVAVEAAPNG